MNLKLSPHYYMTDNKQNFTRKKEIVNMINPISNAQKKYLNSNKNNEKTIAKEGIEEQYKNMMKSNSRTWFQKGYKNIKPYDRAMVEKMHNKLPPSMQITYKRNNYVR